MRWIFHITLSVTSLSCSNDTKLYFCSFLLPFFWIFFHFIIFYLDSHTHRSLSLLTISFFLSHLFLFLWYTFLIITCKLGQFIYLIYNDMVAEIYIHWIHTWQDHELFVIRNKKPWYFMTDVNINLGYDSSNGCYFRF